MSETAAQHDAAPPGGVWFWSGLVVGVGLIGIGLRGLFQHLRFTRVANLAVFFGASGIAHDLLWAPALVVVGVLTRRLPVSVRTPIRVALALSAGLTLFSYPVLHGYAGRNTNPSALPLNYTRNLAIVLAVFWTGVGLTLAVGALRGRRARSAEAR